VVPARVAVICLVGVVMGPTVGDLPGGGAFSAPDSGGSFNGRALDASAAATTRVGGVRATLVEYRADADRSRESTTDRDTGGAVSREPAGRPPSEPEAPSFGPGALAAAGVALCLLARVVRRATGSPTTQGHSA
jgi:hypothetical protein